MCPLPLHTVPALSRRARGDLLDVEVAAPLACPGVGPAGIGLRHSNDAEHGRHRYLEAVAPEDLPVLDLNDLVVRADSAPPSQPGIAPLAPRKLVNPMGSRSISPMWTMST